MNLPTERDLPAGVARRLRAELIAATTPAAQSWRRTRWLVAAAVTAIIATVLAVLVHGVGSGHGTDVLAMGPDEVSPDLRAAVERCLRLNDQLDHGVGLHFQPADVAVAAEQDDRAEVLFLNDAGYLGCSISAAHSAGLSTDLWPRRGTMFGPVDRLSMASSASEGGNVSVSGRIAPRVHRLVLDHGDGHRTEARLQGGAFGLLANGVRADAALIAYDSAGNEISRRPLFSARPALTPACQAVPPTQQCPPEEPWSR